MRISFYQGNSRGRGVLPASIVLATLYSIGLFRLGRELGHEEYEVQYHRQLRFQRNMLDCGGHPKKIYGHLHMAKTGGTSLNGILANKFERVCGNKGYSYDAYHDNELAAIKEKQGLTVKAEGTRSIVSRHEMERTGFSDCDYVSNEILHKWWIWNFGNGKLHGVEMELHVPCRDPIDHLMSQCNYLHKSLDCDASTDEEFFHSVEKCFVHLGRYNPELERWFDLKCFDFKESFTSYVDYMKQFLEERRVETDRYIKRETNLPRDKESECIWKNPELLEKTRDYLLEHVPYYDFCDKCMGSENQLKLDSLAATAE